MNKPTSEILREFIEASERISSAPWEQHPLQKKAVYNPEFEFWLPAIEADAEFIALSRNVAPRIARSLQVAIKALQFYETQHNWPIHADVALQEIDSIFNPKDEG